MTFGKTPRFLHYVSAFNIKSTTWHKAVKKTVYESRILATGDVYSSTFPALRAAFAGVQLIIIDELSSNHPEQLLEINIKLKIACNEVQIDSTFLHCRRPTRQVLQKIWVQGAQELVPMVPVSPDASAE